jgi:uncharacterized membrane protein
MTELTPFKLTPLGLFHTLVSIACVVLAFVALYRDKGISPGTPIGRAYLVSLWVTTLTGFPIFRHGTAGPPHVVGVITVLVLLVAIVAGKTRVFGRASAYVETVSYSTTVLLLMIPTVTETLTRVPPSAPWVASPEATIFPPLYAALVVLFLVGVTWQVRKLVPSRPAEGRIARA